MDQAIPCLLPRGPPPADHSTPSAQSDNAHTVEQSIHYERRETSMTETTKDKSQQARGHIAPTPEAIQNTDMYFVNHIVLYINTKESIRYIVRWYVHNAADDTAKPSENVPQPRSLRHELLRLQQTSTSHKASTASTPIGHTCTLQKKRWG